MDNFDNLDKSDESFIQKDVDKRILNKIIDNLDQNSEIESLEDLEIEEEKLCRLNSNIINDFNFDKINMLDEAKTKDTKIEVIQDQDILINCKLDLEKYTMGSKGIYLFAKLSNLNKPVPMLVDTGASVCIMSKKVYESIDESARPPLEKSRCRIFNASGQQMSMMGKASFPFTVGDKTTMVDFQVTEVPGESLILSFNWLKDMGGTLDTKKDYIMLDDVKVPCFILDGLPSISRVVIPTKIELEPLTEYEIDGKIIQSSGKIRPKSDSTIPMMMEPYSHFIERNGVVPTAGTTMNGETTMRMRVFNANTHKVTLHKNSICGFIKPVNVVATVYDANEDVEETDQTSDNKEENDHKTDFDLTDVPEHVRNTFNEACVHLTMKQRERLKDMLIRFVDTFSRNDLDVGHTALAKHIIKIKQDVQPIKQKLRPHPLHYQEEIDRQVEELLEKGYIQRSNSPWSSNVLLVQKKDKTYRMCIDYRKLNAVTILDAHPIPPISQTIDALAQAKFFCALDLSAGYMNVPMDPESRSKTAFVTRSGLYEWTRMSFGLVNAPSTFQRLMEYVLHNCHWSIAMVYLDDILVYGKTVEETMNNLEEVLLRLEKANLKLKPSKCHLFKKEVLYLGYIIGRGEVKTNPDKIRDIKDFEPPRNDKELRRFLGLTNYYRKFVYSYAEIASPLNKLLNKDVPYEWKEQQQKAFESLKEKLITAPILTLPSTSPKDRYILTTDASLHTIGAVLSQLQHDPDDPSKPPTEKVIAYSSKMMSKCERNYCITRKELLSIVYHVNHFRMYLLGTEKFLIKSDHKCLKSLINFKDVSSQLARWLELLSQFNYEIEFVPGTKIKQADFMSRCPGKLCICDYECSDPCSEDYVSKPCSFRPHDEVVRQLILEEKEEDTIDVLNDEFVSVVEVDEEQVEEEQESDDHFETTKKDNKEQEIVYPWTYDSLKETQNSDKDIGIVIEALANNQKPIFDDIAPCSEVTKALLAQWKSLFLHEGILYRKFVTQANEIRNQIIIPKVYQQLLLNSFHDSKTSGHFSTAKVYKKLHRRYYWPMMNSYVQEYIRACPNCQKKKNPKRTYCAKLQKYIVGNCFERVGMDILGPLPTTYNGNRHILVVVDYFSKWIEAYALADQSAETVADCFCKNWITIHGSPLELFTDQGSNFVSSIFANICKELEIEKFQAIVRRPNSNGFVEIINHSLTQMIAKAEKLDPHNWDNYLPYLSMALRSTDHASTGFSPNKLVFGREILMPYEAVTPREKGLYEMTPEEYVVKLKDYLANSHEIARENLQKTFEYRKKSYLSRLKSHKYQLKDAVYYWNPVIKRGQCKKLLSLWRGPYFVVQIISDVVYRVQESARTSSRIVHHNQIKPAYFRKNEFPDTSWLDHCIQKYSKPKETNIPGIDYVDATEIKAKSEKQHPPIVRTKRQVQKPDWFVPI